ncbi:MAG: SPOR domain-containing protein [Sphingobacteriales bacterium]|nr:MAG: SPOR domain-containing protein [Sphingobacteriales bacterium]
MLLKLNLYFWVLMLCSSLTFAQTKGSVIVIKNPAIDSLIARRVLLNKLITNNSVNKSASSVVVYGFRVQAYFGTDRKEAYKIQAKLKQSYPDFETYISYNLPNYRIKIGDFRNRLEAEKLLSQLRSSYPTLFIFNERINPPKNED